MERIRQRKTGNRRLYEKKEKKRRILFLLLFLVASLIATGFLVGDKITLANSEEEEEDFLILVNPWNAIPDHYTVDLTLLSNGESVATSIYPALQEMFDAARAEGVYPVVASGYRTEDEQQSLLDESIEEYVALGYDETEASALAEEYVALPGMSEHQLGLAVDINADPMKSTAEEVYTWLAENAYQYGFILRYPEAKEDITGTSYEAWHYRYVGVSVATTIYNEDLCLEEYIETYVDSAEDAEE